jgi:MFS transporter, DHA2 family, multidrug resistance protein
LIQAEQQPESISKPLIAAGKLAFDQSFSIIMMIGSVIIGATIILLILLDYKNKRQTSVIE